MTTFKLLKSVVGFDFESIDSSTKKFREDRYQLIMDWGNRTQVGQQLIAKRAELERRDDVRNIRAFWSPDGARHIEVPSFEVACALVDKFGGDSLPEMKARYELFLKMARER